MMRPKENTNNTSLLQVWNLLWWSPHISNMGSLQSGMNRIRNYLCLPPLDEQGRRFGVHVGCTPLQPQRLFWETPPSEISRLPSVLRCRPENLHFDAPVTGSLFLELTEAQTTKLGRIDGTKPALIFRERVFLEFPLWEGECRRHCKANRFSRRHWLPTNEKCP